MSGDALADKVNAIPKYVASNTLTLKKSRATTWLAVASGAVEDPAAAAAMSAELAARPAGTIVLRRLLSDPGTAHRPDSFEFALDVILAGLATL